MFIDEGVSEYRVAPLDCEQWAIVERALHNGGVLYVPWLDRISRRYDELYETMQRLMKAKVRVICTLNGMVFDGGATDAINKATRDAVLAFLAAQGEADYLNRREMQARGIAVAKAAAKYEQVGRKRKADYAKVRAWREPHGASIAETAAHFGISTAAVNRALAEANGNAAE